MFAYISSSLRDWRDVIKPKELEETFWGAFICTGTPCLDNKHLQMKLNPRSKQVLCELAQLPPGAKLSLKTLQLINESKSRKTIPLFLPFPPRAMISSFLTVFVFLSTPTAPLFFHCDTKEHLKLSSASIPLPHIFSMKTSKTCL